MSEWKARRFWKTAQVRPVETGFEIFLDDRPLRTPGKQPLVLPVEGLARAVAQEWDAQQDVIDPNSMPLTRAANSAIEKVTPQFAAVADMLAEYGGTDLLSYRADQPAELVRRQAEAWDPLVDWAARDLRAPLRSIEGFGRILSERYSHVLDAQGHDYLGRVRNAAGRMDALIDALLAMSRITRGEFKRSPLDLSRLAGEVVAELRQTDPTREVDVVIAPGLRAEGDAALVRNLLQNLLGNAWKFTASTAGARIEFTRADAGHFEVRDNGAGFNAEYAGKLFRPFQRLHREDEYSGHGVGLASVKRIVERHGGSISAEGTPGQGATIRFTLAPARCEGEDA